MCILFKYIFCYILRPQTCPSPSHVILIISNIKRGKAPEWLGLITKPLLWLLSFLFSLLHSLLVVCFFNSFSFCSCHLFDFSRDGKKQLTFFFFCKRSWGKSYTQHLGQATKLSKAFEKGTESKHSPQCHKVTPPPKKKYKLRWIFQVCSLAKPPTFPSLFPFPPKIMTRIKRK